MRSTLMLSTLAALIVALPMTAKAGGKTVQHSVQHSEMTVTKQTDKASPKLFIAPGKHIPKGTITVR